MKKKVLVILFLLIIIYNLNLFPNQTLIKEKFYNDPAVHIYNRSIMMQYYGGHIRDYLYKFYSGDFMFFQNRNKSWCNSIVGLLRNPDAYLFYAGKEGNYIKFNKINHSFTSKMKTDNYNKIYTLTKLDNDYMISTFSFNNEGDSIIWVSEYTANEDSCPYAFAINFNQTNSNPDDDKIWTIKDNKINLLYFEIVNYFYFTLYKRETWSNVGGIPNVKYTCIALGKDYGIQNNYIYVYDSLHNMVFMLEAGFENPYQPTLSLVSLRAMPSDWIIKSITTDYFGSVWLSDYNNGYLQSYTPNMQQPLTTANWSFRANKPVSFTMAMDKPYGILTENWTDTTGVRLYKLGTEIFYDTVEQVHPLIAQIRLHFRVTVGSYMTFGVGGSYYLDSSFYLPGEYDRYFNTPYWGTGNKYWSLKAISACTNPDGTPTAVVTKTGSFSYFGPQNDSIPPNLPEHISLSGYVSRSKATDPIAHLTWTWDFDPPDGVPADYTRDSFILYRDNFRETFFSGNYSSGTGSYTYSPYESHVYTIVGFSTNQWNPWNDYNARSNSITLKYIPPPDTGCPYFYIKENGEYVPQNTIMHYGYSNKQDNYLFNLGNRYKKELRKNGITDDKFESKERVIQSAISENEVEKDYIDRVNLKAVKYDSIYNLTL
ncbi:hypothetical protein KAU43_04035, partial [candidate division WOR-3 bacterium]|nr:hypothetical protein [candidate division WOR-3 bacterium]